MNKCDHINFILTAVVGDIAGAQCYDCHQNFYFYLESHDDTWAYADKGFEKIPTFEGYKVNREEHFKQYLRSSH